MLPFSKAGAVDWLADLLGARRVHGPFRFIKSQASLVERKFQIIEQSPDLCFGIIDEIVVDDPVNAAR